MFGKLIVWFSAVDKLYDNEDINKLGNYKTAYQHCSQRGKVIITWSRISHGLPENVQNGQRNETTFQWLQETSKITRDKQCKTQNW